MIAFDVYGIPGPQGSKRFVGTSKTGRGLMVESSAKVKPWREAVKWSAREALALAGITTPLDGPLRVTLTFTLPKPKSAPKTRTTYPDRKPDGSKLQRSTEDALTDAGVWADDARVVEWIGAKRFPGEGDGALSSPGVRIVVERIA
jgi:crossover junction endodeoxyribonuclease RusA